MQSELLFLALGLLAGIVVGAGLTEFLRVRPNRPEVMLTVTHNALPVRPAAAVAMTGGAPGAGGAPIPGRDGSGDDVDAHTVIPATSTTAPAPPANPPPERVGVPVSRGVDPAFRAALAPAAWSATTAARAGVEPARPTNLGGPAGRPVDGGPNARVPPSAPRPATRASRRFPIR